MCVKRHKGGEFLCAPSARGSIKAKEFKEWRISLTLSQNALAERLGVSRMTVVRIERGDIPAHGSTVKMMYMLEAEACRIGGRKGDGI